MRHRITAITADSIAAQCKIQAGDVLLQINGSPIVDQIDYQALTAVERLELLLENQQSVEYEVLIEKDESEPLGLVFEDTMMSKPRLCKNRCVFCFVDQMPSGMRRSLYVKDDDWRLSLMMGNFVTMTNVDDAEMRRIIERKASPLYISVHATDGNVRAKMMGNPAAANIMDILRQLKQGGIKYHCQVVLCPGLNDGAVLEKTLEDLASLHPNVLSVALVPVGLTCHREKLSPLKTFDQTTAGALLDELAQWQSAFRERFGTSFVFAADELYSLSGRPVPCDEHYEYYPQIENGVGLLRTFEADYAFAYDDVKASMPQVRKKYILPTGVSAAPFLRDLIKRYPLPHLDIEIRPIANRFFGESVTVAGLLTGKDLISQLQDVTDGTILLNESMLQQPEERFLDDITLEALKRALRAPVETIPCDGAALMYRLTEMEGM